MTGKQRVVKDRHTTLAMTFIVDCVTARKAKPDVAVQAITVS